ncbi:MAG: ACT domain-containing protein [Candidatus Bipolaricaulia bacterium]
MREFRVTVPHRPGGLAELLEYLAERGINLKAVTSITEPGKGLVALVPHDVELTRRSLKEKELQFEEAEVLFVDICDEPGELAKVARTIADAGVNIESIYPLGAIGTGECCRIQFGFRLDNLQRAEEALSATEEWAPWVGVGGEG